MLRGGKDKMKQNEFLEKPSIAYPINYEYPLSNEINDWYNFKKILPIVSEDSTHPKFKGEKYSLFSSVTFESTEIEYLDLLHSLVLSTKPQYILETGTNIGISGIAISYALKYNYEHRHIKGHLKTVEMDVSYYGYLNKLIEELGLTEYITVYIDSSVSFIKNLNDIKFDLVFFDSSRHIRPQEFYELKEKELLNKDCFLVFHDTCSCAIKDTQEDIEIQNNYRLALDDIKKNCTGCIELKLGRGMMIFQY
jgi:predicted O-methyltransferase YrrM